MVLGMEPGEKAPGDPQKPWRRILDPYRESLRCATALTIPSNTADVRRGLLMLTKTSETASFVHVVQDAPVDQAATQIIPGLICDQPTRATLTCDNTR
jgi:hypothetical protein